MQMMADNMLSNSLTQVSNSLALAPDQASLLQGLAQFVISSPHSLHSNCMIIAMLRQSSNRSRSVKPLVRMCIIVGWHTVKPR